MSIHGPKLRKADIVFCPTCGSASVDVPVSGLVPSDKDTAKCNGCGWTGVRSALAVLQIGHEFDSDEQIIKTMIYDLRDLMASEMGPHLGKFLAKWGFWSSTDSKMLARYLSAIARGILETVIMERRKMDKEKVDGRRKLD